MFKASTSNAFRTQTWLSAGTYRACYIRDYRRKATHSITEESISPAAAKSRTPPLKLLKPVAVVAQDDLELSSLAVNDELSTLKDENKAVRKPRGSLVSLASHLPPLPSPEAWPERYPLIFKPTSAVREVRPFVKNFDTAIETARAFGLDEDDSKGPKTIVELYPGPGMISRAILSLPRDRIHRLILLESGPEFHDDLVSLANSDDRVKLVKLSPYYWETYDVVANEGLLNHIHPVSDEEVHPQLRIVGQLPMSVGAEQLLSQIIRHVPTRTWLWQYGRVPFHLLIAQWVHERLSSPLSSTTRGKLTVLAEATLDYTISVPMSAYKPYDDHLFPPPVRIPPSLLSKPKKEPRRKKKEEDGTLGDEEGGVTMAFRRPGHPMVAVTMTPRRERIIEGDAIERWDYILRHLFVLKKSTVAKALPSLAPGAGVLLKSPLLKDLSPKSTISDLSVDDWRRLIQAFEEWPFAPQVSRHHPAIVAAPAKVKSFSIEQLPL
ncbi:S-adenosyl-L-methionine-dependent methyltransferase [Cantharellus anzutake]|uniref:S-adenosyl-L-methionine-dependent methyltransferase n=1 Tax=Cantharellus anzutake TaxID=1750568 RepID=UPI001908F22B|nr:S-adenosyl-L-methionine-dependent methyltransferase [Cantharellus anzutake]KAF8332103.1 S-adenosyl-L-methionine-dependent methyltransferase [Cantharellus anzutake]